VARSGTESIFGRWPMSASATNAPAIRRQLLANGYEPIPIRGKAPHWKRWTDGEITDARLVEIEAAHPDHSNTGIRTGQCAAIDIDLTDGAHLIEVETIIDAMLGTTPLRRVGSKGALLCYRNDQPIPKITIGLKDKRLVEILGAGQHFAAYGIHPDIGRAYEWPNDFFGGEPTQTPLTDLPLASPDQLFALAREIAAKLKALGYGDVTVSGGEQTEAPKPSTATGVPVTADIVETMLRAIPPSCDRNKWLTVCGGLTNAPVNDPAFDGLSLFTHWSRGDLHDGAPPSNFNGEEDCATEWQRDEAKRASGEAVPAFGALVLLAREHGYDGPSQSFSAQETFARFADAQPSTVERAPRNKFRVLLPKDMRDLPPPSYLIGNVLPANAIVMLFGPPASYKTFVALELAFQIATGKATALGFVAQGAVAYCAGEAPIGIAGKRFPAWMQHRGIENADAVPFALVPAVPLVSTAADVDALIEALKETGLSISLIVVDTVARALGGLDENSAKDAGLLLAASERLRDTFDCTVLLIHHTGKDESRGARGSSALLAGVDAAFEVRADSEVLAVTLRCEKMKDADPPAPMRFQGVRTCGSVVFDPMPEADYAALTRTNTSVHRLDVAAALKKLKAVNGKTVTTHILATQLAGPEAPPDVVESKKRSLQRCSKDRLRAYVTQLSEGSGHPTLWSFPTAHEEGDAQ
jgi:hypothetical protein